MTDDRSDKMPAVGYSASRILDDLSNCDCDYDYDYDYDTDTDTDTDHEKAIVEVKVCMDDDIIVHGGVMDDGDDGYQGFYDISAVVGAVAVGDDVEADEGWYIVGGI